MRQLLLVLTHKYPFEPPIEQFLNNEVSFYCGYDVLFVPMASCLNCSLTHSNYNPSIFKTAILKKKNRLFQLLVFLLFVLGHFGMFFSDFFSRNKPSFKTVLHHYFVASNTFKRLKSLVKNKTFDDYGKVIVYSYWLNAYSISAQLFSDYLIRRGFISKAVSRAHGQGDLYLKDSCEFTKRPCLSLLKRINCIFSISDGGKEHLEREGLLNVTVSRLGTMKGLASFSETSSTGVFTIVSCSVVNKNKNVILIAKALSRLGFKVNWIHFGGGVLFDEVQEWCKNNMPQNINCQLRGFVNNDDIIDFYLTNKPDLFINVSKVEGIPVSIMEALSYSIPCVATNVGATKEIVNGANGFLVDSDISEYDLANIISRYYSFDEKTKNKYRESSWQIWKEKYDGKKNFQSISDDFNKLFDDDL